MIPLHVPALTLKDTLLIPKEDFRVQLKNFFREYFGKENIIFTADARNSLYLALRMMNLNDQDEVLIPSYICDAVRVSVKAVCKPIYVDVEPRTFNIDPKQIEKNITKYTKGIIVAHLYGNPCQMDKIVELSHAYHLQVIEDCAQSLGGTYQTKNLGSIGDFTVLSFRFTKDITSFRGGALLTNKEITNNRNPPTLIKIFPWLFVTILALGQIRQVPSSLYTFLRNRLLVPIFSHNASKFEISNESLCNYQCHLLYKQIKKLTTIIEQRRQNADFYSKNLVDVVKIPLETNFGYHTYYRYTIQANNRDKLIRYLMKNSIEVDKLYDYYLSNLPNSVEAAMKNINIPVHQSLSKEEINKIVRVIHECK